MIIKRYIFLFLFVVLAAPFLEAQNLGGDVHIEPKAIIFRNRLGLMPGIIRYSNHRDYTNNTGLGQGLGASWQGEMTFAKGDKLKFLLGGQYFAQTMSFDSYYNATYFDKVFSFHHKLLIHQLDFPFLFKICMNSEENFLNTFYFTGGWAYRFILGANARITDITNGQEVYKGFTPITVEHDFLMESGASQLIAGLGFEHKMPASNFTKGVFFEAFFRYHISRIRYIGNQHSNNIYFKDNPVTFTLGYEF